MAGLAKYSTGYWLHYFVNFLKDTVIFHDQSNAADDDEDSDGCETLGVTQYHQLIAIYSGKPKDGLKQALDVGTGKIKRLSLSESALEKAAECHASDMVR